MDKGREKIDFHSNPATKFAHYKDRMVGDNKAGILAPYLGYLQTEIEAVSPLLEDPRKINEALLMRLGELDCRDRIAELEIVEPIIFTTEINGDDIIKPFVGYNFPNHFNYYAKAQARNKKNYPSPEDIDDLIRGKYRPSAYGSLYAAKPVVSRVMAIFPPARQLALELSSAGGDKRLPLLGPMFYANYLVMANGLVDKRDPGAMTDNNIVNEHYLFG
jgi:hypothetical protein